MRTTVVALAVLAASGAVAEADSLKLKTGAALEPGEVAFTLGVRTADSDAGESVRVTAYVPLPTTASAKALLMVEATALAEAPGTWRAVLTASTEMSFEHLMGGVWVPVDSIVDVVDTTGGGTRLTTSDQVVDFSLDLDPAAVATGLTARGRQSFITITVTNTLTFAHAIDMGETPESLVTLFEAFLAEQMAEGVAVTRVSATSLRLRMDASVSAAINWQVTDTGLLATAGVNIALIDR